MDVKNKQDIIEKHYKFGGEGIDEEITRMWFKIIFGVEFKSIKNVKWLFSGEYYQKNKRKGEPIYLSLDGYAVIGKDKNGKGIRMAFEHQGKQHYEPIQLIDGNNSETFWKRLKYDELKRKLNKKEGVIHIEIPYEVKPEDRGLYITHLLRDKLLKRGYVIKKTDKEIAEIDYTKFKIDDVGIYSWYRLQEDYPGLELLYGDKSWKGVMKLTWFVYKNIKFDRPIKPNQIQQRGIPIKYRVASGEKYINPLSQRSLEKFKKECDKNLELLYGDDSWVDVKALTWFIYKGIEFRIMPISIQQQGIPVKVRIAAGEKCINPLLTKSLEKFKMQCPINLELTYGDESWNGMHNPIQFSYNGILLENLIRPEQILKYGIPVKYRITNGEKYINPMSQRSLEKLKMQYPLLKLTYGDESWKGVHVPTWFTYKGIKFNKPVKFNSIQQQGIPVNIRIAAGESYIKIQDKQKQQSLNNFKKIYPNLELADGEVWNGVKKLTWFVYKGIKFDKPIRPDQILKHGIPIKYRVASGEKYINSRTQKSWIQLQKQFPGLKLVDGKKIVNTKIKTLFIYNNVEFETTMNIIQSYGIPKYVLKQVQEKEFNKVKPNELF